MLECDGREDHFFVVKKEEHLMDRDKRVVSVV